MSSKVLIAILAGLAAVPASATLFGGLPDVAADQYTAVYVRAQNEIRHTGLGSISDGSTSASSLLLPDAQVSASAAPGYIAVARLSYSFLLTGSTFAVVPLIAYGHLSAALSGAGQVNADLVIDNGAYSGAGDHLYLTRFDQGSRARDAVIHFQAITGVVGTVNLNADIISYGGSGSAFVDPYIIIDPAFARVDRNYLQNYALTFSDGAGNVAPAGFVPPPGAVPEPAAWALLITGFGLTGAAARRRRTGAVTVAS